MRHQFLKANGSGSFRQLTCLSLAPGQPSQPGSTTAARSIGIYAGSDGKAHGFRLENGTFTLVDVPGATYTQAIGINGHGDVVGTFTASGTTRGFLAR